MVGWAVRGEGPGRDALVERRRGGRDDMDGESGGTERSDDGGEGEDGGRGTVRGGRNVAGEASGGEIDADFDIAGSGNLAAKFNSDIASRSGGSGGADADADANALACARSATTEALSSGSIVDATMESTVDVSSSL